MLIYIKSTSVKVSKLTNYNTVFCVLLCCTIVSQWLLNYNCYLLGNVVLVCWDYCIWGALSNWTCMQLMWVHICRPRGTHGAGSHSAASHSQFLQGTQAELISPNTYAQLDQPPPKINSNLFSYESNPVQHYSAHHYTDKVKGANLYNKKSCLHCLKVCMSSLMLPCSLLCHRIFHPLHQSPCIYLRTSKAHFYLP